MCVCVRQKQMIHMHVHGDVYVTEGRMGCLAASLPHAGNICLQTLIQTHIPNTNSHHFSHTTQRRKVDKPPKVTPLSYPLNKFDLSLQTAVSFSVSLPGACDVGKRQNKPEQ